MKAFKSITRLCLVGSLGIIGAITPLVASADNPTFSLNSQRVAAERSAADRMAGLQQGNRGSSQFSVDFVPGTEAVAGINFDVKLSGVSAGTVDIKSCGGDVKGSHSARCEMISDDRLRVLVFSAPVSALPATTVVEFSVRGPIQGALIDGGSVAVSDLRGTIIQADVLQ